MDTVKQICSILEDRKGEDIRVLDVRGRSVLTDYFVLVTAANAPHIKALAREVDKQMKAEGEGKARRRCGNPDSGWMVLDFSDVVVHVFLADMRKYYGLEELWKETLSLADEANEMPEV